VNEEPTGGGTTNGGDNVVPILKAQKGVPPLPPKREVSEWHLANLTASALTPETIELAKLYTEGDHRTLATLMRKRTWPRACGSALALPFYLPGQDEPYAYRLRPRYPRVEKRGNKTREIKYEQPAGSDTYVYFPPRARAAGAFRDVAQTLYWTEGEKKALGLDQLGLACVGLTGVYNWGDKKHKDETHEERLHPLIREYVSVAGRQHVICFDADAKENEQVMTAAQRLAGVLLAAGATSVKFVCPPSKAHKGIDDFYAAFGAEVVLALLGNPEAIEPIDPRSPLQLARKVRALNDAPISEHLRLPEGYEVQKDGTLWKLGDEKHGDVKIARNAILITRYLDDYYTNEARVDVCYQRDGTWVTMCVGRKALADSRTMVAELAGFGAPVTSNSAPKLVDWLEDLERVNGGRLERLACVNRAGWHTIDGVRLFVLDKPIFADDETRPLALDTRGDRKKMFASLEPRGTFEAHLQALKRAWVAEPTAAAVQCAALAATLLEVLNAPNFAVHLAGDSSKGKTSQLKIGGSIFGDPNSDAWIASWNTTMTGAEMRASTLCHLPQCYDEVGASDIATIERMVYMLVNGGGRARAQRDLTMRETLSWRTVVISTGERELADEGTATGAQIRVIQIPVTRFGALTAVEIDEIRDQCAANAGSFGREWIEMLLAIEDWSTWREVYRVTVKALRATTVDSLQGRVASFFAVLVVAEMLASKLGLGEADGSTMVKLFKDASRREAVLSLADRALGLVNDWVLSEAESFPELEVTTSGTEEPSRKGPARTRHGFKKGNALLLIGRSLRSFCTEHRLSVREVLREWKLRGWLRCDGERLDKAVRIGTATPRFYVLDTTDAHSDSPEAPE
jgi:hypothetical protein